MTANMIKGKGFKGALRYNLDKVKKNVAEVLDHSFVDISEKSIMKEVLMVKVMRPNLQKFFYHTSINFPPTEDLTNATMTKIGQEYLRESGFTQHQYIMFRHRDADHPHLHILVNRIGFDGKVLSDSNDFARCEEILRKLERKYNLAEVISSRQARSRAVTKDELEMMKRTNDVSEKIKLQITIRKTLQDNPGMNLNQFVSRLEEKGVNVLFNQASTGYVSGISYSLGDFVITGSKLGNEFKWKSIAGRVNYDRERDRSIIHDANSRTKHRDLSQTFSGARERDQQHTSEKWSLRFEKAFDLKKLIDNLSAPDNPDPNNVHRETALGPPRKKKKRRGRRI